MSSNAATSSTSTGGAGGAAPQDAGSDALFEAGAPNDAAIDPEPTSCDGGGMPPVVGGTPDCPSDKNLPGCPCTQAGQAAACWTGLRENRGHGDCKDGMTTCGSSLTWGACSGEVLPQSGTAKTSCACFSTGNWQIANIVPCFLTVTDDMGNMTTSAFASTPGSPVTCAYDKSGAPMVPAVWSTDTLTVDCTGAYTLCFTIKAGDPKNPQPTDCVVAQSCATGHYDVASQSQVWSPLPGWISDPSAEACVEQFISQGGYGAMSVSGQSDECATVNQVFASTTYCPVGCNGSCSCTPTSSGSF